MTWYVITSLVGGALVALIVYGIDHFNKRLDRIESIIGRRGDDGAYASVDRKIQAIARRVRDMENDNNRPISRVVNDSHA